MKGNLYELIPDNLQEELFEDLVDTSCIRIERIVSKGQASKPDFWYDQKVHEFVLLVQGRAGLRFEDKYEFLVLEAGDYVNIKAHQRHRVEWTEPGQETIWLAIYYR